MRDEGGRLKNDGQSPAPLLSFFAFFLSHPSAFIFSFSSFLLQPSSF
jgi:hypothetical protein